MTDSCNCIIASNLHEQTVPTNKNSLPTKYSHELLMISIQLTSHRFISQNILTNKNK